MFLFLNIGTKCLNKGCTPQSLANIFWKNQYISKYLGFGESYSLCLVTGCSQGWGGQIGICSGVQRMVSRKC